MTHNSGWIFALIVEGFFKAQLLRNGDVKSQYRDSHKRLTLTVTNCFNQLDFLCLLNSLDRGDHVIGINNFNYHCEITSR